MTTSYYEDVDLLDMTYEQDEEQFTSPCPCGDKFFIPLEDVLDNEDEAGCPSCSLVLKVQYDATEIRCKFTPQTTTTTAVPSGPIEEKEQRDKQQTIAVTTIEIASTAVR